MCATLEMTTVTTSNSVMLGTMLFPIETLLAYLLSKHALARYCITIYDALGMIVSHYVCDTRNDYCHYKQSSHARNDAFLY